VTNLGWSIEGTIEDNGVVLRTSSQPDERDFRHFVDF